nr:molybdopterin-guanine dinucleotide biosynthesis protein MobB [uncultured Erwinia sp.]
MDASVSDLILLEGFKQEEVARIVLHRFGSGKPLPLPLDQWTIAVASDVNIELDMPCLDLNNVSEVADFIERWLSAQRK